MNPIRQDSSHAQQSANHESFVQIPSSFLNSLIVSIDSLRNDVSQLQSCNEALCSGFSQLRQENASLTTKVQVLQQNSGALFRRFPDLPPEIRCLIWEFALTSPQIHMMSESEVSKSRVNTTMQACKEARDVLLKLDLPYFSLDDIWDIKVKNYVNLEADTIWLKGKRMFLPDRVIFFCAHCTRMDLNGCYPRTVPDCEHGRLRCIAIDHYSWEDPGWEGPQNAGQWPDWDPWRPGSLDICLNNHNVREVYIVVGNTDEVRKDRNAIFVPPRLGPQDMLEDYPRGNKDGSWKDLAAQKVKVMEDYKAKRIADRKKLMEGILEVLGQTEEAVDEYDFTSPQHWVVPKVTYVEAISRSEDWMFPCIPRYK